jgi:thiosulfate/3-mercaptopyruvate sulfurtransferase
MSGKKMATLQLIRRALSITLSIFLVLGCSSAFLQKNNASQTPPMDILVSTQWLSTHLDDPQLVVLDSTVIVKMDAKSGMSNISGLEQYLQGHIPHARFADLKGALSNHDSSLDFVMPTPEQFAAAIGELGIDNQSKVVIYTTGNHVWSTRLWWMLRWAGLEQVAVLDGGYNAWITEGRAVSTLPVSFTPKQFNLMLKPELIAARNEVFHAITDPKIHIVDALPPASYSGQYAMYARPGHIPTASNVPSSELVTETGRYKSFDELDMMQNSDRNQRVITYCGGGVAASGTAFTLHRLGFKDVAVYMGSLQEWAKDPENPMTTDEKD